MSNRQSVQKSLKDSGADKLIQKSVDVIYKGKKR